MASGLNARARRLAEPPARLLVRVGVHPNVITVFGLLLNGVAGVIVASGQLAAGGALLLVASACDALDGTVARLGGRASAFGALLDSSLDRVSEAALLAGLLYLGLERGQRDVALLAFGTMVAAFMVSYVRARAEGLRLRGRGGVMPREVRVVVLALGLLGDQVAIALWLTFIGSAYSAAERLYRAWREAADRERE